MARERDYELGIVLGPETPDEQARAIVERITSAVTAQGGAVVRVNAWGRRRLAYPIEHHRDGLYFFFDLQLPPSSVVEVERLIGVNEDIIRHLVKARDPRVIGDERKRAEEAEIRARQQAEARAAQEAEAAANAAATPPAATESEQGAQPDEEVQPVDEQATLAGAEAAEMPTADAGAREVDDTATADNEPAVAEPTEAKP
jgi:small subunit ribosomal protein S6